MQEKVSEKLVQSVFLLDNFQQITQSIGKEFKVEKVSP